MAQEAFQAAATVSDRRDCAQRSRLAATSRLLIPTSTWGHPALHCAPPAPNAALVCSSRFRQHSTVPTRIDLPSGPQHRGRSVEPPWRRRSAAMVRTCCRQRPTPLQARPTKFSFTSSRHEDSSQSENDRHSEKYKQQRSADRASLDRFTLTHFVLLICGARCSCLSPLQ